MFGVRLRLLAVLVFLMMALVVARLAMMQILLADHYREEGMKRQVAHFWPGAARGKIVARDGKTVLAEDRPVLSICVELRHLADPSKMTPADVQNWYAAVADIVGDSPEEVAARLQGVVEEIERGIERRKRTILSSGKDTPTRLEAEARREERALRAKNYSTPKALYEDVEYRTAFRAEVESADLPGLAVAQVMKRRYPQGTFAAHALGYMSVHDSREYDLYRYDYHGDERKRLVWEETMGRKGVEEQYNYALRGSIGHTVAIVNTRGQKQMILFDEKPVEGDTIVTTIDPAVQKAAEEALWAIFNQPDGAARRAGAAVCMDVHTGEVLAMASSPGFSPNSFGEDYASLVDINGLGHYKPLVNRATSGGYPLGSVFKIVTATAALEQGAITPETQFTCTGLFHLGTHSWRCHIMRVPGAGHGSLSLCDAMRVSCNVYFYQAGHKAGGTALYQWASRFGLGSRAGIDLPSEAAGNLRQPRFPGDVVNLSIGQGTLLVTPLQVCRMVAAVANGGKLLVPRLMLEDVQAAPAQRMERGESAGPRASPALVGFSPATWGVLRQSLYDVVNVRGGTGYAHARSDLITIAGKSGTAQAPPTKPAAGSSSSEIAGDHAWFAGFAPYESPEIAIAVVIEHGGGGGAAAGPVAKAIAEAYARSRGAR